ncbi:DUF6809 family protein [Lachnospiraceae bacterium HCP1S3_A8]
MNFYETQMGKIFFNSQLPKLIQTLEDLSKALQKKMESVKLPVSVPGNYLEDLYFGNLEMGIYSMEGYTRERPKEITNLQNQIQQELTEEQWKLFSQYDALIGKHIGDEACRMYQNGFRQAVRLIVAGLSVPEEKNGNHMEGANDNGETV